MNWGEPTHEVESTEYRQNGVYFIFDNEGKILVTQSPAEAKKGLWSSPQGGRKPGEPLGKNLLREMLEEFPDIDPNDLTDVATDITEVFTQDFSAERIKEEKAKGRNFRGKQYHTSTARYVGTRELSPNPEEILKSEFVTPKEAERRFRSNKEKYTMLMKGMKAGITTHYK